MYLKSRRWRVESIVGFGFSPIYNTYAETNDLNVEGAFVGEEDPISSGGTQGYGDGRDQGVGITQSTTSAGVFQ